MEIYLTALQVKMRMIEKLNQYCKNINDDNQDVAQSGDTSDDADSSSYGNEDTRVTSNMGTHKHMEEIVLAGSEEESGAMIPAETVLDYNTEYDWKIQHTGLMKKLEDRLTRRYIFPSLSNHPLLRTTTVPPCKLLFLHSGKSVFWS